MALPGCTHPAPPDPVTARHIADRCHRATAADLVAAVGIPTGARVLDLGSGTGVAATAARAATGPTGRVVALDPEPGSVAAVGKAAAAVVGAAPGLPFATHTFDAVLAHLVLGQLADPRRALHDVVRVLRPGGRVGLVTWGRTDDAPPVDDGAERAALACWDEVVDRHVDLGLVDDLAAAAAPWEDAFTDPAHLRIALAGAHLRVVTLVGWAARAALTHAEWLDRTALGARARAAAVLLGPERSDAVRSEVAAALRAARVPDPVPCVDEVLCTVAVAPVREPLPR